MGEALSAGEFVRDQCRHWLGRSDIVVRSLAPGFSGSTVYRVDVAGKPAWVVKSVAAMADAARTAWVHGLMRHLRSVGIAEVPEVVVAADGRGVWHDVAGGCWELVGFVAGVPVMAPTLAQTAAAAGVLARLHVAAATYPVAPPGLAVPPALVRRIEHARKLVASPWAGEAFALPSDATPLQRELAERVVAASARFRAADGPRIIGRLATLRPSPLPVQAVIRDVSSDHVLFGHPDGDRVAGIIDFSAAAIDTPATDLARLIGSWERSGSEATRRAHACAAYEEVRPLGERERRLVPLLATSGTVLGLDNWFRWVLVESREFAHPAQAVARVDQLVAALPEALAELAVVASAAV